MKNTFLFKGTLRKLFIILTASVFLTLPLTAQYTYTTESFEEGVWPTSDPGSTLSDVTASTGTWQIAKAYATGTPAPTTGTKCLTESSTSFQLITPQLTEGVGTITFQAYSYGGSNRTITIATSVDGTAFTDHTTTANLSKTDWELVSVNIQDASVRYIRLKSNGSGVVFDDILIASPLAPKLTTPTVGVATAITTTGFTANWTPVANAIGYTITVYQGFTLVGTYDIAGQASASLPIVGLTTNTSYTFTVIAKGDDVTWRNSDESAKSAVFRTISSLKAITAFTLLGATGTINEGAKTIDVAVPFSTVLPGAYTPTTVTISSYATLLTPGAQTFNLLAPPTTYTVQAEDLTTQNYLVTVTKAPASTACDITSFSMGVPVETVSINQISKTISVTVAGSDDITSVTPVITNSFLSSITSPAFPQNFTGPVIIRVTAEDGVTFKDYTVNVIPDGDAPTLDSSDPVDDPAFSNPIVSLAGLITLTYNENLVAGAGAITISGGGILGAVTIGGKNVTIPFSGLSSLTNYTLTIPAGVFEDKYGNPVAAKTISFRTADGELKIFPYTSHMDGASFSLPAFITGGTYDATVDSKAATTTQYGAYVLTSGQSLTISTIKAGTIYASVYAPGPNRTFQISDNVSGLPVTNGSINAYDNNGTSIERVINSNSATVITITNTGGGDIYIPYLYISDVNQPRVTEKESWCK